MHFLKPIKILLKQLHPNYYFSLKAVLIDTMISQYIAQILHQQKAYIALYSICLSVLMSVDKQKGEGWNAQCIKCSSFYHIRLTSVSPLLVTWHVKDNGSRSSMQQLHSQTGKQLFVCTGIADITPKGI